MSIIYLITHIASSYDLSFSRPQYLPFLWLIPLIWIIGIAGRKRMGTARLITIAALRTMVIILTVFALAGLSRKHTAENPATVLAAVDVSDSMGNGGRDWANALAERLFEAAGETTLKDVILFARGSEMLEQPSRHPGENSFVPTIRTDATDLSSAIRTALISAPSNGTKHLFILSDGNETQGNALEAADIAAKQGMQINCFSPPASKIADTCLTKLDIPEEVTVGEKFVVRIIGVNRGTESAQGDLTLKDGAKVIKEWPVTLPPGTNAFELSYHIAEPGTHRLTAILKNGDTARGAVSIPMLVMERPSILCLSGDTGGRNFFAEALSLKDIDVRTGGRELMPGSGDELGKYDAVVLSNIPRSSFTDKQATMLKSYVQDRGGGLIMLGGGSSFGSGGWGGTPVEEVLPVNMGDGKPFETDSVVRLCIILLIDKSGSMGFGFGDKIIAARRAAEELVKQLKPSDMVGIIPFDASYEVLVPLGPVEGNAPFIIDRIRMIASGGDTLISEPLSESLREMQGTSCKAKHVILLTDGQTRDVNRFDYRTIISAFAQNGITVSTIGIGGDANSDFLRAIARGSGGDFYFVKDATTLPLIVLEDTRKVLQKSGFLEDTLTPRIGQKSEMLKGISPEQLPRLMGYTITTAKKAAEVALYADIRGFKDPILASWRSGLGKTVAFTSDAEARWSAEMVRWKMYGKFWTQVVRWAMRDRPEDYYLARLAGEGERRRIELLVYSPAREDTSFRIALPEPARKKTFNLHQSGPENFAAEIGDAKITGDAVTVEKIVNGRIVDKKEVALRRQTTMRAPSPEDAAVGNNSASLKAIAERGGGQLNPDISRLSFPSTSVHVSSDITAWLMPLIFAMLLADIAARKFGG